MSTISTGLFNSSGALTAPVINTNSVNFTSAIQYINSTAVPSQNNVNVLNGNPTSLVGKVLVVQGGTQTSS
jgi:BRCT domain type II-containing protein